MPRCACAAPAAASPPTPSPCPPRHAARTPHAPPGRPGKGLALSYGDDLRPRESAEAFGVTASRICQIHAQAILSIRAYLQRFEAGMSGQTAQTT